MTGLFGKKYNQKSDQNVARLKDVSTQTESIIGEVSAHLEHCERGECEPVTRVLNRLNVIVKQLNAAEKQLNAVRTQRGNALDLNSTSPKSQEEENNQSTQAPIPKS